jgi:hypothetical protein
VSILTDEWIDFEFPEPTELKIRMKDLLDDEVGDEYYIRTEKADKLLQELKDKGVLQGLERKQGVKVSDICGKYEGKIDEAACLMARDYKGFGHQNANAVLDRVGRK